ncbi:hypothetical protein ACFVIK_17065 [Paenibacillus chitinolyticus]
MGYKKLKPDRQLLGLRTGEIDRHTSLDARLTANLVTSISIVALPM